MMILRFIGGLGNQLFIYSFGRAMQINHNVHVYFDSYSGFKKDVYKRKFELDNFNTNIKRALRYNSFYFPIRKRSESLAKTLFPGSFYIEEDQNFDLEQFITQEKLHRKIFIEGYFQNQKYFENIKDLLQTELTLNTNLSEKAKEYLKTINNYNSVAVHIRLKERANLNQLDFYSKNISRLKNELHDPTFFLFSDDINWCKKNMKLDSDVIFIVNSNNQIEDFWLMKNCNNFIISNSTFSWWAAFLSDNSNKIIISPNEQLFNHIK